MAVQSATVNMGAAPMDMQNGYEAHPMQQPAGAQPMAYQQADTSEQPAQQLQRLQGQAAQLAAQQLQVRAALAERLTAAAAAVGAEADAWGSSGGPSLGPPLPDGLPRLAAELAALTAGIELQGLNRHAEGAMQRVEAASADPAAYLAAVEAAVAAYETASQQAIELGAASAAAAAWCLQAHIDEALGRTTAVRDSLYGSLLAALQLRLAEVGWPPPIASLADPTHSGGAAAAPADAKSAARVFAKAPPPLLAALQQLLAAMFALQRADDPRSFEQLGDGAGEGPPLWGVAELAAPLVARLRRHFGGQGMPTDRTDRPEWLFATAGRLAADLGPALAPLQPAVAAAELEQAYAIQFEFARAIREGVKALLREHLLPRLAVEGAADPGLWTHLVTEAAAFERRLAPSRGVVLDASTLEESQDVMPGLATADGCLTVIFEDGTWQEAWLAAECAEAMDEVTEAMDAPQAWQPLDAGWAGMDLDEGPGAGSASGPGEAWQQEFWPPVAADAILNVITGGLTRAGWLPSLHQRRAYLAAVPQEVLQEVVRRLGRLAEQAAAYKDIAGPEWGPKVAALVCAAHFLEHHLREGPAPLLLLDLQSETAVSSEDAGGGGGRRRGGRFEREAVQLAAFRREWGLKLAKALAAAFSKAAQGYRLNLDAFAGVAEGEEGEVSARLAPAITSAAEGLARLGAHLDSVAFREVWRAVAVALNRTLYNDVATEAAFSPPGAAQFGRDVRAVAALLGPYTRRPAAHFRELLDAVALLTLPADQARHLHRRRQSAPNVKPATLAAEVAAAVEAAPEAGLAAVRAGGAGRLSGQQARRVLAQRL